MGHIFQLYFKVFSCDKDKLKAAFFFKNSSDFTEAVVEAFVMHRNEGDTVFLHFEKLRRDIEKQSINSINQFFHTVRPCLLDDFFDQHEIHQSEQKRIESGFQLCGQSELI